MEIDRALELAVISSWEDIVASDEECTLHVVYEQLPDLAVNSLEVRKVKNRGYEDLICRYSISRSESESELSAPRLHFANSYSSRTLADNLDFIMRNQCHFSYPADRSVHGLVQIHCPSDEDRKIATSWSHSLRIPKANTRFKSANLFSKKEKSVMSDTNRPSPTQEQIRLRAYEIYEARGCQDDKQFEDWITAEKELNEDSCWVTQKTRTAKAG